MANLSNINNKFIVTDGGQALVNQTAPGFNVDADDLIVGNLSGNTGITIASGSSVGNYGSIYFADAAGQSTASKAGYIRYEQNTSKMTIGINAVEKIAIDIGGNTTITTTSNQGGLTVTSATDNTVIGINNTATNGQAWRLQSTGGSSGLGAGKLFLKVGGTEAAANLISFITDSSGNNIKMGIGTTSPDAKLHIYGSASLSEMYLGEDAATDKAGILKYTQGNGSGTGVITLSHWGNNSLIESLAIKYGGNVGIGTTDPNVKLRIAGTQGNPASSGSTSTGFLSLYAPSSSHGLIMGVQSVSPFGSWIQSQDKTNHATNYNLLLNPNGGNVGIGTTSPGYKLEVNGNIRSSTVTVYDGHGWN